MLTSVPMSISIRYCRSASVRPSSSSSIIISSASISSYISNSSASCCCCLSLSCLATSSISAAISASSKPLLSLCFSISLLNRAHSCRTISYISWSVSSFGRVRRLAMKDASRALLSRSLHCARNRVCQDFSVARECREDCDRFRKDGWAGCVAAVGDVIACCECCCGAEIVKECLELFIVFFLGGKLSRV
ncbi:hypothetical protein DL89DRAFT_64248 [Linderina pennispora]|uniref:Uncharacterized protein n=1 Tax=Linderina pennispora TaxID=61395 RepID=A0A1Y1VZ02_9FUNG|nr:uncharacterized protein DL89DRAFT_64248 [Linderina pennispora]ORX66498.1 hypothetical protein DL89DRAFT_64248 [Linderina pennispora]